MKRFVRVALAWTVVSAVIQVVGRYVSRRYALGDEGADEFRMAAIATGAIFRSRAKELRSGSCRVVMGGAKIDLREAQLDPSGADLHLDATMGGIRVGVPSTWRVEVDTSGVVLGGVDQHLASAGDPDEDAPCLRIRASARMGGIVVGPRP